MLLNSMRELFLRDIARLKDEITLLKDEEHLWLIEGEIKNSAGNLALHLVGNLSHYIGQILGGSGYKRNREKEFTERNVSKEDLLEKIDYASDITEAVLSGMTDEDLKKIYPENVLGKEVTAEYFLIYLLAHLNYHLGQINYLRRITQ